MRFVLVDDEELALDNLVYALGQFDEVEIVGQYQLATACLEEIANLDAQVLITDISMPDMDGLELASRVQELFPKLLIVFMTSYDTFALRSYEIGAFDYILKPFTEERLKRFLDRVKTGIHRMKTDENAEIFVKDAGEKNFKNYLTVNKEDAILVIQKSEIIYSCSQEKKTYVYTAEGCFKSRHTLETLEEMLLHTGNFIRCHRSFLVNIHYVREISPMFNQTYLLRLKNSHAEIPVSRNHAPKLKKLLGF